MAAEAQTVPVRRVDRAFTEYEMYRLNLYRARAGNPEQIELRRFGHAWASRFPAVRYFNQVQGVTLDDLERLSEIDAFYANVASGYKIQVAPDTERPGAFECLADAGFVPRTTSVRMMRERPRPVACAWPDGLSITPARAGEEVEFFQTYLECFGAVRAGWSAAVDNMRLLFGRPEVQCFFARMSGRPAGVGMLYVSGGIANFCAGAVLPPWRGAGLHSALINERLRFAADAGYDLAIGWCEESGASHRNLERAGFTLAYRDPIWSSPAGRCAGSRVGVGTLAGCY